jgi:hypothetical protein
MCKTSRFTLYDSFLGDGDRIRSNGGSIGLWRRGLRCSWAYLALSRVGNDGVTFRVGTCSHVKITGVPGD